MIDLELGIEGKLRDIIVVRAARLAIQHVQPVLSAEPPSRTECHLWCRDTKAECLGCSPERL